jgi:hypothetical protein
MNKFLHLVVKISKKFLIINLIKNMNMKDIMQIIIHLEENFNQQLVLIKHFIP